jgi:hypothetical protein
MPDLTYWVDAGVLAGNHAHDIVGVWLGESDRQCARFGVGVVEAISTSMRFETRAGIRSGDGVSTISGVCAEGRGHVLAIGDVVAVRLVVRVAKPSRRAVQHDAAAQLLGLYNDCPAPTARRLVRTLSDMRMQAVALAMS